MITQPNEFQGFLDLAGVEKPGDDIINTCVRCGLCLQSCPTYVQLGREPSSPRGRIALIRGVAEGRLPVDSPGFLHQMEECLGCLACQAVCPSGVAYGHLLEAGRAQARAVKPHTGLGRVIEWLVFRILFMRLSLFRLFARSLWLYQRAGWQELARRLGLLKLMGLAETEQLLPKINDHFLFARGQRYAPALPANGVSEPGSHPKRAVLLTGCVQSVAFARVHEATIQTLQINNCEVVLPRGQQCCGALHAHGGDIERARRLARQNIAALEAANPDYIVVNAAGCSHHLKEYRHLLQDDPVYAERAKLFVAKTRDVTELLAELGPKPAQTPLPWQVTYQEPCHLAHGQKIIGQPRRILAAIPELKLMEMKDSAMCCGSAGTYNLTQPEMARKLQNDKLDHALATGASVIASANTGCMLQLEAGLKARGKAVKVMHIVEILDAAYRNDGLY
jgi:glycolate oxidase iron-sulfur subunit